MFSGGGQDAMNKIFGNMGSPSTPLQQQSTNQISQFLNQQAPEQRALEQASPMLQNILNSKPGAGVMDALQPHFQTNLAIANDQGGRFGSSNAILKSQAVNDYNLLGAQAAQQGQQTQLQAGNMLGMLSGQAGQNPFQRLMGGYGIGAQGAGQQDIGTQRMLQMLGTLMGGAQQASFNVPYGQTSPAQGGLFQGLGNMFGSLLGSGGLGKLFGGGGPSGTPGGSGGGDPFGGFTGQV
jgi:hypothetical protein